MSDKNYAVATFSDEPRREARRSLRDVDAERVVSGDPQHHTRFFFESEDGALNSGTWTSTPGKWRAFTDRDEFCYIVSGHCRLIDDEGFARDFKTGDAFLIPNGFIGYWEVLETTTKHFVIRSHEK